MSVRARAGVRHQLESAHGPLQDFYKMQPGEAERLFMKLGRREGKAKPKGAAELTSPG